MAIEHDLLSHTLNILPIGIGATTEDISPISHQTKKRKSMNDNKFPNDILEGFRAISRATVSEEIVNCDIRIEGSEKKIEDYIKKIENCNDNNLRIFYQERLDAAKAMLARAISDYEKLQE